MVGVLTNHFIRVLNIKLMVGEDTNLMDIVVGEDTNHRQVILMDIVVGEDTIHRQER